MEEERKQKRILTPETCTQTTELHSTSKPTKNIFAGGMDRRDFISYAALAAMFGLAPVVLGSCGGGGGSGGSASGSTTNISAGSIMSILRPYRNMYIRDIVPQLNELADYKLGDVIRETPPTQSLSGISRKALRTVLKRKCKTITINIPGEMVLQLIDNLSLVSTTLTITGLVGTLIDFGICVFVTGGYCSIFVVIAAASLLIAWGSKPLWDLARQITGGGVQITYALCDSPWPWGYPIGFKAIPLDEGSASAYSNASFAGTWEYIEREYDSNGNLQSSRSGKMLYDSSGKIKSYTSSTCKNGCGDSTVIITSVKRNVSPDGSFTIDAKGYCNCSTDDYAKRRIGNGVFTSPTTFKDSGDAILYKKSTGQILQRLTYNRSARKV